MPCVDENMLRICAGLGKSALAGSFYLAGGTGLAIQLGHRRSLDLDFFQRGTEEKLAYSRLASALRSLFGVRGVKLEDRQVDQATWDIAGTRVTFLAYPFPLLEPLTEGGRFHASLRGLLLAPAREIALMKAYNLGRRTTFRDYVDLYFLLKRRIVTLEYIITEAPRKFVLEGETLFSPKLFLEQLVYTEDLPDREVAVRLVASQGSPTAREIELFLREEVRRHLNLLYGPEGGGPRP